MEENKKSRRSINRTFGSKSVLGSLFLAVVAVVAVVALGFKNSYAIPDVTSHLPDTFTTQMPGDEIYSDTSFAVFPYFTDGDIQVFCLEHMIDYQGETTFTKGDAITDYGLLYLMANIYPNKSFGDLDSSLQTWISQVAVWMYLYELEDLANDGIDNDNVDVNSPHYISNVYIADQSLDDLNAIKTAKGVTTDDFYNSNFSYYTAEGVKTDEQLDSVTTTLYDAYIKGLVESALANRNTPNKTLTINFADEIAVTQDEKYYQTSAVSVVGSPSDNFNGYELKISSAPDGTFVVNADGEKVDDLTNLSSTDKLYFRVPVNSVTEESKSIYFTVTGSFKTYEGNYYVADGAQTISSVGTVNNNISKGDEISLNYTPEVPDTGMSTAQTVYFIGLIILLSGVGIIYANVKPQED